VHVGDGAEALVAHVRLMAVCARWDWKTAPEGANS
jgi:hypothetical protein